MICTGFKCLKCFSVVFCPPNAPLEAKELRTSVCRCSNLAIILDDDNITHAYCDDLTTVCVCKIPIDAPEEARVKYLSSSFYVSDYSFSGTKLKAEPVITPNLHRAKKREAIRESKDLVGKCFANKRYKSLSTQLRNIYKDKQKAKYNDKVAARYTATDYDPLNDPLFDACYTDLS